MKSRNQKQYLIKNTTNDLRAIMIYSCKKYYILYFLWETPEEEAQEVGEIRQSPQLLIILAHLLLLAQDLEHIMELLSTPIKAILTSSIILDPTQLPQWHPHRTCPKIGRSLTTFQCQEARQFNRFTMELEEEQTTQWQTMSQQGHASEQQVEHKKH